MNLPAHATLRIGLLADSTDPFWVEVRETIWLLTEPSRVDSRHGSTSTLSDTMLPAVELVDIHSSTGGLARQDVEGRAEEILALGLDALISVPFAMPVIERLLDNGLPVISLHSRDLDHPHFSSPASLYTTACLVCDYLARQLGGRGRVLCIGGNLGATAENRSSRVQAAIDIFARHAAIELIHVPTPWDYAGAQEYLTGALEGAVEPFDGIFGLSDTLALLGREVAARFGLLQPGTIVVGINGDPLAIAAVARGDMAATVVTSAARLALEALHLACDAALGKPLPQHFDYQPQLVTRENVAEIALDKLLAIANVPSRLVGVNRWLEERRLMQLQTSLEINRRIGSILDRDLLLREIAELIRSNYGYDHVQIYLWQEEGQLLARCLPEVAGERPAALTLQEAGVLSQALLYNRSIYLPDLQQSPWLTLDPAWPETRARVVVPIRLGGRVLGVVDLHSNKLHHHHQVDLDALQLLADQLGVAMRNAQLYAQALDARAEAERANLLKSRLLANVSHELRTPLNIILGYSQAALDELGVAGAPLPSELHHDLRHIQRSGQDLGRLVDDLLNLSQAESGGLELYPETIDVRALLADIFARMAGSMARDGVEWRLQLPASMPAVDADPLRLRQVIQNLLSNAGEYTTTGHVALSAAVEAPSLHIWIEDTGAGIPHPLQERIFEAFAAWQPGSGDGERPARSVGLGLSVAHHIVAMHGGTLQLASRPGHGTTCHVVLPMHQARVAAPGDAEAGAMSLENMLEGALFQAGELTRRIAGYIAENYTDPIARDDIAEALKVSPNYVSRLFRKETGMSPWQYLNRYRVAQAQKLLISTNHNVTEIASLVGIGDPAYFVRVFHKETGKSPQQYRKSTKM